MTNVQNLPIGRQEIQSSAIKPAFDLEERTGHFGELVIEFAAHIPKSAVTLPLISQIVRSGTSVGANYMEADGAITKKDFVHKLSIARKEAKETMHWLRMIAKANPIAIEEARALAQECRELVKIFSAILR